MISIGMRILALTFLTLFLLQGSAESATDSRGIRTVAVGGEDLEIGTFHMLGIAVDEYRDSGLDLKTAVAGARELQSVLTANYSFEKRNSRLLLNAEATRDGIIQALRQLAKKAGPKDSVLIYYAGHGHLDELTKTGSWIPWDATFKTPARWINNEDIKRILKAMKARHVLLVSDSCFAGDFFRSQRNILPQITDANVRRAFSRMSRRAMTAGGLEPVADGGSDGQSVYTWWLLTALREAASPYVLPEDIHDRVKKAVANNALQDPMYGLLHGTGGEPDGTFVFFRSGSAGLDEALKEKMNRIKELEALDRKAAEKLRRQHEEIAGKQAQMEELGRKLDELQKKVGAGSGQSDLDLMLAMLEQKEHQAKELEALRKKAEEELRAKEAAIAKEKRRQQAARQKRFEADYAKFRKIEASRYAGDDLKLQAWQALCRNWGLPEQTPIGGQLVFADGRVELSKDYTDPVTGMEMVYVKGGCYQMGDLWGDGDSDEKPVHEVCVDDFYIGKHEVTQGQWKEIMGNNPSYFKDCGDNCPVEQVSWNDAQDYIKKLNRKTGKNYRLPTEVEWEYAARSGGKKEKWAGTSSESELGEYAWYRGNSGSKTRPVGQKRPNGLGIYDMSGNVWEWVGDWYHEKYYQYSPKDNPKGPGEDWRDLKSRVVRGGSWGSFPGGVRAAGRCRNYPVDRGSGLGFRIARTP